MRLAAEYASTQLRQLLLSHKLEVRAEECGVCYTDVESADALHGIRIAKAD